MAEAWVATFKTELVDGHRFPGYEHAEHEIVHWIGFYNDERLHEELGDFAARRIRGVEYQDRQRPNPGWQIKEPLRNPGASRDRTPEELAPSFLPWVMKMARMPVRVAGFNKLASVSAWLGITETQMSATVVGLHDAVYVAPCHARRCL
jgi:hypothetical protein